MSIGTIHPSHGHFLFNGLSSRTTDTSAQNYTLFSGNIKDVGYVFSSSRFVGVYVWNGTSAVVPLDSITKFQNDGIIISGMTDTENIPAMSSVFAVFEVTKYGPLSFSATFTFYSGCTNNPVLTITGTRPLISTDQPRPIDLSTAMEEAYTYAGEGVTYYDTLEFASSGADDKVMVVYSDENLTTPQGEFIPCKFDCTLPETEGKVRGQMQISVDFLPREAQAWLRQASQARGHITVKWRQYLGANIEPDAEYPIPLEIVSVEQTPTGVTATALFPDLVNMPFPRRLMTTKELPGGII